MLKMFQGILMLFTSSGEAVSKSWNMFYIQLHVMSYTHFIFQYFLAQRPKLSVERMETYLVTS